MSAENDDLGSEGVFEMDKSLVVLTIVATALLFGYFVVKGVKIAAPISFVAVSLGAILYLSIPAFMAIAHWTTAHLLEAGLAIVGVIVSLLFLAILGYYSNKNGLMESGL